MSKVGVEVEQILAASEKARDSDNLLLANMLQNHGLRMSPEQWRLFMSVNFESVTRCRRKLQREGKYPPSPEVAKQRRLKAAIVQQNIPKTKAENVPELISQQPVPIPGKEVTITDD